MHEDLLELCNIRIRLYKTIKKGKIMNKTYIVLEIQTNNDGTVGTLIDTYDNRGSAESKYHLILSAAAVSQIPQHSCVLMTDDGFLLESKSYDHRVYDSDLEPEA